MGMFAPEESEARLAGAGRSAGGSKAQAGDALGGSEVACGAGRGGDTLSDSALAITSGRAMEPVLRPAAPTRTPIQRSEATYRFHLRSRNRRNERIVWRRDRSSRGNRRSSVCPSG